MQIETELIAKIFLSICLVFFVGKFAGTTFQGLFSQLFKGKKNNVSLDILIERNKNILRQGGHGQNARRANEGSGPSAQKKYGSKTEEYYVREFKNAKDSDLKHKMGEVLSLFDNIRWGEGNIFKKIQYELSKEIRINVDLIQISKSINQLVISDIFISLKHNQLPSLQEIKQVIKTKTFFDIIINEIKKSEGKLLEQLSEKFHVRKTDIMYAIYAMMVRKKGKDDKYIYNYILNSNEQCELPIFNEISKKILIKNDRSQFVKINDIFQFINEEIIIISIISPLPKLETDNLDSALKLFDINKETSIKEISKKYKQLASKKHPDRLSGKRLPDEFIKIANDNFQKIQSAYNIIKKHSS